MRVRAHYYQQFDADPSRDVPAEGYGGWKTAEIDLAPERTALVVMHAWDFGKPEEHPGWRRAVEYIPRAEQITRDIFPTLLCAARASGLSMMHVVSNPSYCGGFPGYRKAVALAGEPPAPPEQAVIDPSLDKLREFRASHVFVGKHNEQDVRNGFERMSFPEAARPLAHEGIAACSSQLHALCRQSGANHLIYAGFAINWCLLLSPGGMAEMSARGYMCSAIREATTAVENRETARTQAARELALWRVALAFGFVFDLQDILAALNHPSVRARPR